jgi:beta-mannosidase
MVIYREGFPNIRTVDYWLGGDQAERHPQSRIMNNHNKADGFERRLELYLVENFKHAFDIERYEPTASATMKG